MKTDFYYSTDFNGINCAELGHTCLHLLCMAGEGSFVFNGHCYHIVRNDLVVIPMPDKVKNIAAHADMQVEWFAADYKFLQGLLPSNNYSIGGSISLNQNPVIRLTDEQAGHLLDDFHRLHHRMEDRHHQFYLELMALLSTGISCTERDVSSYARRLHVSPKYLSACTVMPILGIWFLVYLAGKYTLPSYYWWAPICVLPVIAFLTILLPILSFRRRDTPYGFAPHQADEFAVMHGIASLFRNK